jgi:RNA polymerase sigma factor (sigma-70 family)
MAVRQSRSGLQQLRTLFGVGTSTGLDDGQLLEQFVDSRDEVAFAALVARHGPLVLGACRRLLTDPADVEDAFQATFLVLVRKASSLRDRRLLGTWLYKVADRVALRARAGSDKRTMPSPEEVAPGPAEDLVRRELRAVIDEEILRLPWLYRQPVVLCYLEGLTHEEAARQLGCPLGTVNSRLATARLRLRVRLSRRGLAPSAVLVGAASQTGSARTAVPTTLLQVTLQAAQRVVNGSAVAGVASTTVAVLTEGVLRAMITAKIQIAATGILALGLTVASLGLLPQGATGEQQSRADATIAAPRSAAQNDEPQQPVKPDEAANGTDAEVPVRGKVLMPDGSPAVGATVEAMTSEEPPIIARTNDTGQFQLQGVFGLGSRLHASSADGRHQIMLLVSSAAVRSAFTSPIELSLAPALTHEVIVLSVGRPVEGAHVVGGGQKFRVHGVTGRDGKAKLLLPATEQIYTLAAWHREFGVNAARGLGDGPLEDNTTRLELLPPGPLAIRVVDSDGKAIGGLELDIAVRIEGSDWIELRGVAEARVRTDAEGTAAVPWAPREKLKIVNVRIIGSDWKKDETDLERIGEGITTVHASRTRHVEGRLVMPEGASAEGLLITGNGTGTESRGDRQYARARRDGTFALRVRSDYTYELEIDDTQWASERWSGMIVGKDVEKPTEIIMNVYPATPLTIRVTRGRELDPVVSAWVVVSSVKDSADNIRRWLWTDARGVARTGVGKGEQKVTLRLDPWTEERTIQVGSNEPVEVEFNRPSQVERHVTGRLLLDGALYAPSPMLVARGWTPQTSGPPLEFQPQVRADGTFEVDFDTDNLSLLFVDPNRYRSVFARLGRADSAVDLTMVATATYSGTLLDEKVQPLSNRTLQLDVKTVRHEAVPAQRTDKAGRFRFEGVPAQVPLQLLIRNEGDGPEYDLFGEGRLFEPGEVRENDQVKAQRMKPPAPVTASSP